MGQRDENQPRRGAGRPPLGERKRRRLNMMVPPDVLEVLDERAAAWECSRSEALARIVRDWTTGDRLVVTDEGQGEEESRDIERVLRARAGEPITLETLGAALDP